MPAPLDPAKLDHAIQLYLSGQSIPKAAAEAGVGGNTLRRAIATRGIPAPDARFATLPADEVVSAYMAGTSEYALAQQYGVSRNVIARRLAEAGIQRRSHSKAGQVRAAQMSPEQRAAQAAAAHDAVRGTKQSLETLERRAMLREQRGGYDSEGERQLAEWLAQRGLSPLPQKAIGKYNVDIAVSPIAVEVLGGGWHLEKRHHATRTPQILNAGWHLAFVWNHEGDSALTEGAADYVVSFLDEIRREPPTVGQYRVISGDGQLLAAGGCEDDKFPLVPPPRGSKVRRP